MNENILIPKRVTIETVFGCNANCIMCVINHSTERKKGIMPWELFTFIIEDLVNYKNKIEKLDLFGLGEPLLDPLIFQRIKYVKDKGFQNISISTNADLLNKEKQKSLLETGIDTILFSIDGTKKQTHESIRRGVAFERVVENCKSIINLRDNGNYRTKFIIRFIIQDINKNELEDFKNFWKNILSKEKNDMIITYDMHSWGGQVLKKEDILKGNSNPEIDKKPCHHFTDILYILADGTVPICHEDALCAKYNFGNVKDSSPISVFNSAKRKEFLNLHNAGKKTELDLCRECTILYSELDRKKDSL